MLSTMPIEEISPRGDNVPLSYLDSYHHFMPSISRGMACAYRSPISENMVLDALLTHRGSDVLVVSLHGATDRDKYHLPRFEWLRTLTATRFSTLYLSDPTLHLDDRLQLAWYTGTEQIDLYPILAGWAVKAAAAVGAAHVLFLGSSGGGLAALQMSAYVEGSMALSFSCQTSISKYLINGTLMGAQRDYVKTVMPHLAPMGGPWALRPDIDWSIPLGSRTSALRRYSTKQPNRVLYVQNKFDYAHVEQHYEPFRESIESGPNVASVRFQLYSGPASHNPPSVDVFTDSLGTAVEWLRQSPAPTPLPL